MQLAIMNCLVLLLLFFLSGCKEEGVDSSKMPLSFSLQNEEAMHDIANELTKQSILFVFDKDKSIHYSVNDYAQIYTIKRNVLSNGKLDSTYFESQIISTPDELEFYKSTFEAFGVRYSIINHQGIDNISWSQMEGEKADLAIQCVLKIQYQLIIDC